MIFRSDHCGGGAVGGRYGVRFVALKLAAVAEVRACSTLVRLGLPGRCAAMAP
jgi:hypothetical protein